MCGKKSSHRKSYLYKSCNGRGGRAPSELVYKQPLRADADAGGLATVTPPPWLARRLGRAVSPANHLRDESPGRR